MNRQRQKLSLLFLFYIEIDFGVHISFRSPFCAFIFSFLKQWIDLCCTIRSDKRELDCTICFFWKVVLRVCVGACGSIRCKKNITYFVIWRFDNIVYWLWQTTYYHSVVAFCLVKIVKNTNRNFALFTQELLLDVCVLARNLFTLKFKWGHKRNRLTQI